MATGLSKTQIDRLGNRIRKDSLLESDLKSLDEYRRSFGEAYTTVVQTIREQLHLEPTGRPAKSTNSNNRQVAAREHPAHADSRYSGLQDHCFGCDRARAGREVPERGLPYGDIS